MKLLCVILIVCWLQADQYLLFDTRQNQVGSLSFHDKTVYLKENGFPVETLRVVFTIKHNSNSTYYYVENEKAEGYIMIDCCTVVCDLMLWKGRDRYYKMFYLKVN